MKPLVIGICGGTGSGKTTLAKKIEDYFNNQATLLSMDSYYKNRQDLTYEERTKINYDHPDAFDLDLLEEHVKELKAGHDINAPVYDFSTHLRTADTAHIVSRPVIILEGILLFACPEVLSLCDLKIFVDTDADVRILRRVVRDVKERGRSLESVVSQYLTTVKPMHECFIEPFKRKADLIVPEGGYNQIAYETLIDAIEKSLERNRE